MIGSGWRDEEVEGLEPFRIAHLAFASRATVLNEVLVDDATARWIVQSTCRLIFQEESLVDSLVDYNESDLWSSSILWIELAYGLFELRDLYTDDCVTLGITDSITEDDEVSRH